jgi:hypothetical protein
MYLQGASKRVLQLSYRISIYSEGMYSVLNYQDIANQIDFHKV